MLTFWHKNQQQILLGLAAVLFLLIVLGQVFNWSYSVKLVPVVVAILAALALLVWEITPLVKVLLAIAVMFLGFIFEVAITHLSPFSFGDIIGLKLFSVPIIIGVLWFLTTLSAWHIVRFGNLSEAKKFILAGLLILMLNLILNQFATTYNFWDWNNGRALFINNLVILGLSELIFYLYYRFARLFLPSIFIAGLLPLMALFFWLMLL
ncbi:MAG TPA: carotenoid biosynthesis protein [Patescibacteria group bacterium]|nr:carotenoid biosynthesis protein [Patescibacteria group bacterium]